MAMRNVNLIKLELKYCENCGALWLRKRGERLLHCQLQLINGKRHRLISFARSTYLAASDLALFAGA